MYAQQSRLIDLVEAAYRPEASYARWLDQLAELARDEVGRGEMAIAIAMSGARSGRLTTLGFGVGAASAESRTLMEAVHGQLGAMFEGLVHAGPLAGSALELVAGSSAAEALKMGLMRFGFGDVIGIVAQDGDGAVVGLAAPVRERAVINHARRTRFLRLALRTFGL